MVLKSRLATNGCAALAILITCGPSAVAAATGAAIKAQFSNLKEITAEPGFNNVDLYAAKSTEKQTDILPAPLPSPFQAKGTILAMVNLVRSGFNSVSYIVYQGRNGINIPEPIRFQNTKVDGHPEYQDDDTLELKAQWLDQERAPERIESEGKGAYGKDSSVRFFSGKFGRQQATLVFEAEKWPTAPYNPGSSQPVRISVYELQADPDPFAGMFIRMARFTTSHKYCDVDVALWKELSVPMPAVYAKHTQLEFCAF